MTSHGGQLSGKEDGGIPGRDSESVQGQEEEISRGVRKGRTFGRGAKTDCFTRGRR